MPLLGKLPVPSQQVTILTNNIKLLSIWKSTSCSISDISPYYGTENIFNDNVIIIIVSLSACCCITQGTSITF